MTKPMNEICSNETAILLYDFVSLIFMFSCAYEYIGYILHDKFIMAVMPFIMLLSGLVSMGMRLQMNARKSK